MIATLINYDNFSYHQQLPYQYVPSNWSAVGHDCSFCCVQSLAIANTPQLFQTCFVQTKGRNTWTSTLRYSGNQCPEQKQSSLVCSENRTEVVSVLDKKKKRKIYYCAWQCICLTVEAGGLSRCRELKCWSNFIFCKVVTGQCTFN